MELDRFSALLFSTQSPLGPLVVTFSFSMSNKTLMRISLLSSAVTEMPIFIEEAAMHVLASKIFRLHGQFKLALEQAETAVEKNGHAPRTITIAQSVGFTCQINAAGN